MISDPNETKNRHVKMIVLKLKKENHGVLGKILILKPCFGLRMSSPRSVRSSLLSTASTRYFLRIEAITAFSSSKANFWPEERRNVTTYFRFSMTGRICCLNNVR